MDTHKKNLLIGGLGILLIVAFVIDLRAPDIVRDEGGLQAGSTTREVVIDPRSRTCIAESCLEIPGFEYPAAVLSESAQTVLREAYAGEIQVQGMYKKAIDEFGPVRPFIMLIRSREVHLLVLAGIADKYGIELPTEIASDTTGIDYATREVACESLSLSEAELIAQHQKALETIGDEYPDMTVVLSELIRSGDELLIPALNKCSE